MMQMTPHATMLLCRLKWTGYRCRAELGIAGLGAVAVLLVAAGTRIGIVEPSIHRNEVKLEQLVSGQIAYEFELAHMVRDSKKKPTMAEGKGNVWQVLEKYRLSQGEVKHRQLPAKKNVPVQPRNLISLPSTGDYKNFRAALKDLDTLPDVKVETFSLSRKSYTDRLLAIDMTLSVSSSTEKPGKQKVKE